MKIYIDYDRHPDLGGKQCIFEVNNGDMPIMASELSGRTINAVEVDNEDGGRIYLGTAAGT